MPCSMNIDKYSILFLDNTDIDLLFFLEMFIHNEGVYMVPLLMVFIYFACAFLVYYFHR
jgi:hypothetical protein